MSLNPKNYFHMAMVVPDFDAACAELGRSANLTWSPELVVDCPVWSARSGKVEIFAVRAIYSIEAPHMEVIRAIPDTIMEYIPGRPLHHVGYWADDLLKDSAALEEQGFPRVACAMVDGQMFGYAYHATRDGLLLELVDRAAFPDWEGFLHGRVKFGAN